ncbi:MAG: 4-alpha-glucanotransferase [Acidobacteria bacterium]|nr:4-alpha-glucanotransferase [Acidobacteriota bacterium]NIM62190.1 4-alpha-glucanotransferase [Acidobacteriota bacterium]NIO58984.1 4-alpha-glucanotransferase [Acidobacteriota bacterium]NIQ30030.1 4-alpha-glucanotransferase [Acidobacteriota bacterium]NIQ84796.1 4-alpha-glucanotransferase [Acidobacteriota bacterium]
MNAPASGSIDSRRGGVLAHVSSLPGPAYCGDFGLAATSFLDWCSASRLRLWQVLPLGPTGPGHSPYAATSCFACNPLWYAHASSPERNDGDRIGRADPSRAVRDRLARLESGWRRFRRTTGAEAQREFEAFRDAEEQRVWLEDWTLYAALKERFDGRPWFEWDADLRRREKSALRAASREHAERQAFHAWVQYELDTQARSVRARAEAHDVVWLGDLPFGVARDSADVWSRRDLFRVDDDGRPDGTTGCPPDEFSPFGQNWHTPLFDWEAMNGENFAWWIARCRATLRWTHALRLDHFRGYSATWVIPPGAASAGSGRWVEVPGDALFSAVRDAGIDAQLIAEDLGEITPDVLALRDRHGLPGTLVLQFGLEDPGGPHHPSRHHRRAVVYTGTHDNDTFNGWFEELVAERSERVRRSLGPLQSAARAAVEACWASPAAWAIAPLQDLLELGSEARMNEPGRAQGQWTWRCDPALLDSRRSTWLAELSARHGRA